MLRTMIQTTDESGRELPISANLHERISRAAKVLSDLLRGVGQKFNIDITWRVERSTGSDMAVTLSLVAPQGGMAGGVTVTHRLSKQDLETDDAIRRCLWAPIKILTDILSEEVDREFERLHNNLQTLVAAAEE